MKLLLRLEFPDTRRQPYIGFQQFFSDLVLIEKELPRFRNSKLDRIGDSNKMKLEIMTQDDPKEELFQKTCTIVHNFKGRCEVNLINNKGQIIKSFTHTGKKEEQS